MKTKVTSLGSWVFLYLCFCSFVALAQTNAPPALSDPPGPEVVKEISLWQSLIALAVPAIIAALKAVIPKLPKKLVPWLAPVIGAIIDIALNYLNLGAGMGAVGAVLGTAGIGVRELFHNTVKEP